MDTSFMAVVENIYYSLDFLELKWCDFIDNIVKKLQEDVVKAYDLEDYYIYDGVKVITGIKMYPFGFSVADKYRVYFAKSTGDNYPVYVVLNAQYLHLNNIFFAMAESITSVIDILEYYSGFRFRDDMISYKLSRFDICNHNVLIDMDKYIKPNEYFKYVVSKIRKVFPVIEKKGERGQEVSYFRYGSGDIAIRFYNKVREICEQRYKAFFFQRWLDYGLIDERTFKIYDMTYKYGGDYRTSFLYAHLNYHRDLFDDLDQLAFDTMRRGDNTLSEKYEFYMEYISSKNIKLVKEVVNVEYQVRSGYLRELKIDYYDKDGNVIKKFSNVDLFDFLSNINLIYHYLTHSTFRVVSKHSNTKRLRDATTDKIWSRLQSCKVLNVADDFEIDINRMKIYKEYNKQLEDTVTCRDILSKLAHLTYINNDVNYNNLNDFELAEVLMIAYNKLESYNNLDMNENYFNIKDKLLKQIHLYGEKNNITKQMPCNAENK
jgi:hypothetical protein